MSQPLPIHTSSLLINYCETTIVKLGNCLTYYFLFLLNCFIFVLNTLLHFITAIYIISAYPHLHKLSFFSKSLIRSHKYTRNYSHNYIENLFDG